MRTILITLQTMNTWVYRMMMASSSDEAKTQEARAKTKSQRPKRREAIKDPRSLVGHLACRYQDLKIVSSMVDLFTGIR